MHEEARTSRSSRLAMYTALAGTALPAATACGAILSETGLNLVATEGNVVGLDFGTGDEFLSFGLIGAGTGSAIALLFAAQETSSFSVSFVALSGTIDSSYLPRRLNSSFSIGSGAPWAPLQGFGGLAGLLTDTGGTTTIGDWAPNRRGGLGLRFIIEGGQSSVYAWVDVECDVFAREIIIHGWAYESEFETPIHFPAPSVGGLALLAMGAAGVRRSRRHAA